MLQRFTQVGEFYVMSKPEGAKDTQPGFMDLLLYDEESDRHVKITYEAALEATGLFVVPLAEDANNTGKFQVADLNGSKIVADGTVIYKEGTKTVTFGEWNQKAFALNTANKDETTVPGADAPIVLSRPFIEHAMLSAVLTVSGGDTGATIFGPSDMQISANTSVKTIEGHYTGHFRAIITKPQNVFVLKDIMANGYRAGGNTKFFVTDGDIGEGKKAIMERLNMDDTTGDAILPSLLAFPMSAEQYDSGNMDTVMSVTTRLLPYEVTGNNAHKSFPGGENMFAIYNNALGLRAVHFGEDMRASENMEYLSQGSTNNALCFMGPHRKFDPLTGAYTTLVPGMGHWGPDARPGDARWRRGESVNMVSAREAMLTYEQLSYIPKPKV